MRLGEESTRAVSAIQESIQQKKQEVRGTLVGWDWVGIAVHKLGAVCRVLVWQLSFQRREQCNSSFARVGRG